MGQLGGNPYNWTGTPALNNDMTRYLYRRKGTVTGVDGLAREGSYFADEFIRPDQVPPDWLQMSVKKFVNWLYKNGTYEGDPEQYKAVEHWEDPAEFIARKLRGDCEAFAVAVASRCMAKALSVEPGATSQATEAILPRVCMGKRFQEKENEVPDDINHAWALLYEYPKKDIITLIDTTVARSKVLASPWPYVKQAEKSWGYKPYVSFTQTGAYFEHWR